MDLTLLYHVDSTQTKRPLTFHQMELYNPAKTKDFSPSSF